MGIAALPDATSDMSKAKLASFFWDTTFIKTVSAPTSPPFPSPVARRPLPCSLPCRPDAVPLIAQVKLLVSLAVWGWSYPDQKWLSDSKPFIALSLPYIAFTESYYEGTISRLQESATKELAEKENLVEKL